MRALFVVWWPLLVAFLVVTATGCGGHRSGETTLTISVDLTSDATNSSGSLVSSQEIPGDEAGLKSLRVATGVTLPEKPLYINGERWKPKEGERHPNADWPNRQLTVIADYGIYGADVVVRLQLASRQLPESVATSLANEVLPILVDFYTQANKTHGGGGDESCRTKLFFHLGRGWRVEEISVKRVGAVTLPEPKSSRASSNDDGLTSNQRRLLDLVRSMMADR